MPAPRALEPTAYATSTWLFLRLLSLVYFFAFGSLALQIQGLIGHDGILPAQDFMASLRTIPGGGLGRYSQWPTLFWLSTSDRFITGVAFAGTTIAALATVGIAPALCLPLLWAGYLSLSVVCRDFCFYQWDALLLEAGLLAIPLAPLTWRHRAADATEPSRLSRALLWWLLFRFTFGSGIVKLASGDPMWRSLDALAVHFQTQPLPTPMAWYVSRLPAVFHKATTAAVLAIELIVPWLIVAPRRARHIACVILVALQTGIALTGNYTFFNLLTVALCLLLIDDDLLRRITTRGATLLGRGATLSGRGATLSGRGATLLNRGATLSGRGATLLNRGATLLGSRAQPGWRQRYSIVTAWCIALLTLPVSIVAFSSQLGIRLPAADLVRPLWVLVAPLRSVNTYGLFAVMTTTRPEIIVEGSNDGITWLPYEFPYKPGDTRRGPRWAAPYQPRLDWQMWFAALSRYEEEPWYQDFCRRLLEGSPSVQKLLAHDPFGGQPPRWVRGVLYRYRFADAPTRRASSVFWTREELGLYSPPISLAKDNQ